MLYYKTSVYSLVVWSVFRVWAASQPVGQVWLITDDVIIASPIEYFSTRVLDKILVRLLEQ